MKTLSSEQIKSVSGGYSGDCHLDFIIISGDCNTVESYVKEKATQIWNGVVSGASWLKNNFIPTAYSE